MSFEAYKREALALERQLEDKVNRYQQVRCKLLLQKTPKNNLA
jgi:hypothetical protein